MRIAGTQQGTDRRAGATRTRGFQEALRGARQRPGAARGGRPGAPSGPIDAVVQALRERRAGGDRHAAGLRDRRETFGDRERELQGALAPPPGPAAGLATPRLDPATELRAVVRALPVAIEAARVRGGEPLSLSFGRALSVDLRQGKEGLELVLRPDATLSRAAAAELPALVAALRERGIAIARAEVRAQPNGDPAARRPAR